MDVRIVSERETYLLVARNSSREDRFAVVERRNGRLYNCHCSRRHGVSLNDLPGVVDILDEADWVDLATAQAALDAAAIRWRDLAETML